ncbi:MAG: hypothetical protein HKP18_00385, partial [Acidimicrobiia bacterium]|nr:hypothetical protein [Acidimicrobiia bacterium]
MAGRKHWLLGTIVLVVVLSACGGDDSGGSDEVNSGADTTVASGGDGDGGNTDPTSASTTTTAPAGNTETPPATEMGSFSVNDAEYAVTFLNRCIPFGGEDGETIDLQPLAQGQGAQLNLYGTADSLEVSVQG